MRAWKFWDSGEGRREGLIRWEDKNFLRTVISASLEIGGPSSCVLLEIGPSVRHDWKIIRVDCSVASFSFVFFFFSRIESYATGVAKERFESSSINWGKRKNIKKKKKRKKRPKKKKKKRECTIHLTISNFNPPSFNVIYRVVEVWMFVRQTKPLEIVSIAFVDRLFRIVENF